MENVRKTATPFLDIGDDARRQYVDAQSAFTAWEDAAKQAAQVRGGMYWKRGATDYLIRTAANNSQKSLGARSPETESIYSKFIVRKEQDEARVAALAATLTRHQRMNRALLVGRAPQIAIDVLTTLAKADLSEHFIVVGTYALYAYEAAAGVRIQPPEALATQDVDLLWDTRKRIRFVAQMKVLDSSMLGLLKKVDPSFRLRSDQLYTAVNDKGFEVDIIRREAVDQDRHPLRMTDDETDLWAVQAKRAGALLSAPKFSSIVVSPSGHMARMNTISPVAFAAFKRWMAEQQQRDTMKRSRDRLQADLVEQLAAEYLPHLVAKDEDRGGRPRP